MAENRTLPLIWQAFTGSCWMLAAEKFKAILAFLELRSQGQILSEAQIQQMMTSSAPHTVSSQQVEKIAIIPLVGVHVPRVSSAERMSTNLISLQEVQGTFEKAVNDPEVTAIVLDVDSPGGSVQGVEEFSRAIFEARGVKPVVAIANATADSGAFYIASAAEELVVTPSGEVGSIGVIGFHLDESAKNEKAGEKWTIIQAGRYKSEFYPQHPLTDEARAAGQEFVDGYYELFVQAVARNRGVSAERVVEDYGQGRVVAAKKALQLGMVDRIATFQEVINELVTGTWKSPRQSSRRVSAGRSGVSMASGGAAVTQTKESAMPDNMSISALTAAELKAQRPEIVAAIRAEFESELNAKAADAVKAAVTAERERAKEIFADALAVAGEDAADAMKLEFAQKACELMAAGANLEAAGVQLRNLKLSAVHSSTPGSPGPNLDPKPQATGGDPDSPETWEKAWEKDEELRTEFGKDKDAYLAYMKADSAGRVKILKRMDK